ncbi:hypothetical protein [Helicobacter pylori]|nr:hypothetical protein [Helicobacter pylori]
MAFNHSIIHSFIQATKQPSNQATKQPSNATILLSLLQKSA